MTKDKDTDQPSETPFTDGLKQAGIDPNEERKGRLKLAIKNHAARTRKVKAKRAPK